MTSPTCSRWLLGCCAMLVAGCGQSASTADPKPDSVVAANLRSTVEQPLADSDASNESATVVSSETVTTEVSDFATLRGRFVYDGAPPQLKPLVPTRDHDVCGKQPIPDESLVVDRDNAGIANIILYLRNRPGTISPSYDTTSDAEVTLDNISCRFEPHVLLMRTSQTIIVGNKDNTGHNSNFYLTANSLPNQLIAGLSSYSAHLPESEARPVKVDCNIHPWMSAYLVVKDHPYVAKTDTDGKFEIKDLPCGEELEFRVWHESSGWVRKVKSEQVEFGKRGFQLTMTSDVDLGTVQVNPENFK